MLKKSLTKNFIFLGSVCFTFDGCKLITFEKNQQLFLEEQNAFDSLKFNSTTWQCAGLVSVLCLFLPFFLKDLWHIWETAGTNTFEKLYYLFSCYNHKAIWLHLNEYKVSLFGVFLVCIFPHSHWRWGLVDGWKAFNLISSGDYCQRFSHLLISDTPQAGFEAVQNLCSGFF